VRERGVQARRARGANGDPGPPRTAGNVRFWQALAIVALIAATAGWTTVAVIALRPSAANVAVASPTVEPLPTDDASVEPPIESHDVADLEALLPPDLNGTSLTRESWTGDTILGDDSWSTSLTTFLTDAGKAPSDLQASQAYDAAGSLDMSAGAFRVAGIEGAALRDAMIAAWKGDYPDLKVATTKIGGLDVTTGDFGDGGVNSYWYVRDNVVFDIETSDLTIAQTALAALPLPGASSPPSPTAPASASPAASPSPS
jgi:hypothetical protein